jgi:hypothetical protein
VSETVLDKSELAEKALQDTKVLNELIENLSGASRRVRQVSASALGIVAKENPALLIEHASSFVDALNRPEAQTRWESLDVLTACISVDSRAVEKAIPGAETALFDEDSGPVRLAAMRFICKFAATTPTRSEKLWPLIDEGIQCYHGDLEFSDMLVAITEFSLGKIAPSAKEALAERMKFDAENGKGSLRRKAQVIVANVS